MFNVKHENYTQKKNLHSFHNVSAKKIMCHITLSNILLIYTYKPFIHIRTCHATNLMLNNMLNLC